MTTKTSKIAKASKQNSTTLLLTSLVAAGAVAYVFLLFIPGQKAIGKIRAEHRQKQEAIVAAEKIILDAQGTNALLEKARDFKAKRNEITPTVDRIATVFATISNYTKLAGASIVRFDPQSPVRMASISQVPVVLTVEGGYQQIFSLLQKLDETPNPIWEKEVIIQANREKADSLRCQITLTIFADNRDSSN